MKKIFLLLALLISTLSFSQIVDGIKAKAIDGIEIVNPQTTFDFAEDLSKLGGVTTENLNCVFDGLNRLQGTEGFVMVPSGYEATRLFQQIPNVSTGLDFDVARSTTATRINDKNIIVTESIDVPRIDYSSATFTETEPESINLVLQSQDYNLTGVGEWVAPAQSSLLSGQLAPDGSLTAFNLVEDSSSSAHFIRHKSITITSGNTYTASVFVKSTNRNIRIAFGTATTTLFYGGFDLQNGVLLNSSGNLDNNSIELIGGYYKISITGTATGTETSDFAFYHYINQAGSNSYLGDGTSKITIWGSQLSETSVLTRYVQTTTAIAGIPPLYDMEGCGALLTEPSSENLVLRSEEFDNASWTKTNATVTANTAIAPDGTLSADEAVEDNTVSSHRVNSNNITSSSGTWTVSVFCKKNTRDYSFIGITDQLSGQAEARFDLNSGTTDFTGVGGSGSWTSITSIIEDVGNGWFKCSVTAIQNAGTAIKAQLLVSDGTRSYLGDGTSSIHLWGAQLEQLSYPTSYIPTVASTVTRGADTVTDAGDVTTFNSEEGVFYCEISSLSDDLTAKNIALSDGGFNNGLSVGYDNVSNRISALSKVSGVTEFNGGFVVSDAKGFHKVAINYKQNSVSMWVDGVLIQTQNVNTWTSNTLNSLHFNNGGGTSLFYGNTKSIKVFKTALTDAELARLTKLNIPFLLLAFRRKKKQEFKQAA